MTRQRPWRSAISCGFGLSHPCTTFDKWRLIPVIDDHTHADPAMVDFIHTFF